MKHAEMMAGGIIFTSLFLHHPRAQTSNPVCPTLHPCHQDYSSDVWTAHILASVLLLSLK